jgi:hypothetical protein
MAFWQKLTGTSVGAFIIGLTGVRLKNSGGLQVRNNADTAFANVQAQDVIISNNTSGFDVSLISSASQTADISLTLPANTGSVGQVLQTDGTGVLSWVSAGSNASSIKIDSTTVNFGDGATITAFTLPANAVVYSTRCIVDTAFDGTPSLSVGIAGNTSKYMNASDLSLLFPAETVFEAVNGKLPVGTTEAIEIAYTAGGATVGSARVEVQYAIAS